MARRASAGRGWVKNTPGDYYDAIHNNTSRVSLVLVETSGAISPRALDTVSFLARRARGNDEGEGNHGGASSTAGGTSSQATWVLDGSDPCVGRPDFSKAPWKDSWGAPPDGYVGQSELTLDDACGSIRHAEVDSYICYGGST